ncbi:hypothetical protein [Micromonospora sp. CB01531]|uniref:hypothetical protein n=1 Tax=Micromonospora sp. CB01531 TaxID=1718947 RepID=UPI0011613CB4|nr:hypothetical protein [Micromonospora sp. CB01531]
MPPAQPVVPPAPAQVPASASRPEPLPAPAPADRPDTLRARPAAHRSPAPAAGRAGERALPASPGPSPEAGPHGMVGHVADPARRGYAELRSGTAEPGGPAELVPTVPERVLIQPHTTILSTEQLARAGAEAAGGDPERPDGADAAPDDDDPFADLEPDDAAGDHRPGLTLRRRGREAGRLSPAQAARLEEELRRRFLDRPPGSLR